MTKSVSIPPFDVRSVAGKTDGVLDDFDYIDGMPGLIPHPRATRVPLGAPITVGGWALDPIGRRPRAVCIVLDGHRVIEPEANLSRGDIAANRVLGDPLVGFRSIVATDDLLPGGHEFRAYALGADGAWYACGYLPFWLGATPRPELPALSQRVRIGVDQIADLSTDGSLVGFDGAVALGRCALLIGWAIEADGKDQVSGVMADAGGGSWSTPCDVLRPDLRASLAIARDRIGFELEVPTGTLRRGRHTVRLRGFDPFGRLFRGHTEISLDVAGAQRPFPPFARERLTPPLASATVSIVADEKIVYTTPLLNEGGFALTVDRGALLELKGWALDSGQHGAEYAFVELAPPVENVPPHRFAALAGFHLDERPAAVRGAPLEDAWFRVRIPTETLPRTTYAAALVVVESDRRSFARLDLGTLTITGREELDVPCSPT